MALLSISSQLSNSLIMIDKRTDKTFLFNYLLRISKDDNFPYLVFTRSSALNIFAYGAKSYNKRLEVWDPYATKGIPLKVSISEMGPSLLAKMLNLTEIQSGVLHIAFRIAKDKNLLLVNFNDLRATLKHLADNSKDYELYYGFASTRSINAIYRAILLLENSNHSNFFSLPSIETNDLALPNTINLAINDKLSESSQVYSSYLITILTKLSRSTQLANGYTIIIDQADNFLDSLTNNLIKEVIKLFQSLQSKGVFIYLIISHYKLDSNLVKIFDGFILDKTMMKKASTESLFNKNRLQELPGILECIQKDDESFFYVSNQTKLIENIRTNNLKLPLKNKHILKNYYRTSQLLSKYDKVVNKKTAYYYLKEKDVEDKNEKATRKQNTSRKTPLERTLSTAIHTFGRQLGNSFARKLIALIERKLARKD